MFHLKRKSFFKYNLESIEEMIVKKPRKELQAISNGNVLLIQSSLFGKKPSNSNINKDEPEKIGDLEAIESSFFNFEDTNENLPKKKENKIMKLLKFKNKRDNSQNPKPVKPVDKRIKINPFSDKFDKRKEINPFRENLEIKKEIPDDNFSFSNFDAGQAPTVPSTFNEPIKIKSEPIDPDYDIPSNPPNEYNINFVSPAAKPVNKKKKGSLSSLAKVNPIYIGINGNYMCPECPYVSEYITHFERHTKNFHPNVSIYKCEICPFQSKSKSYLSVHTMNHLGLKPYKCTMCEYASPRKDYVNMHMKSHTKEVSYFCELCDYQTYRKDYLNRHVLEKHYKKILD